MKNTATVPAPSPARIAPGARDAGNLHGPGHIVGLVAAVRRRAVALQHPGLQRPVEFQVGAAGDRPGRRAVRGDAVDHRRRASAARRCRGCRSTPATSATIVTATVPPPPTVASATVAYCTPSLRLQTVPAGSGFVDHARP